MRFVCAFWLFSLEEGRSSDMLGGQWSWWKPGEDFCRNYFAPTGDAKCPGNILPRMLLYVWWWKFFISTGIWDVKYPWNNFPQNTSATLGECFGFSNLFAVSRIFGRTLHGFKDAPRGGLRPKKTEILWNLKHYIVEREMCFLCVRFVYVFILFGWRKVPGCAGWSVVLGKPWGGCFYFHRYLRCQIPSE